MSERAILDEAYRRLRQNLAAKDVSVEALRAAALDALDHAYRDSDLLAELARLRQLDEETSPRPDDDPPR